MLDLNVSVTGVITREQAEKIVAEYQALTPEILIERAAVPLVQRIVAQVVRVPEHYITATFDYMNDVDTRHAEHSGRCADAREVERRMFEAFRDFYHVMLGIAAEMADIDNQYRDDPSSHDL